jgi:hypothetical protein
MHLHIRLARAFLWQVRTADAQDDRQLDTLLY